MNGLGNEGAFGVANILQQSGTITHIDVSNNRIGPAGAAVIGKALEANHDLLKTLKVCVCIDKFFIPPVLWLLLQAKEENLKLHPSAVSIIQKVNLKCRT